MTFYSNYSFHNSITPFIVIFVFLILYSTQYKKKTWQIMVLKMKDQESEEEIKEAFKVFDKGIKNKKNKKFNIQK